MARRSWVNKSSTHPRDDTTESLMVEYRQRNHEHFDDLHRLGNTIILVT